MGFYPVAPGTDQYVLGSPLFDKVTLQLENGNELVINAPNNTAETRYIESMEVNGEDYGKNYLNYDTLMDGAVIDFTMSEEPNELRGTDESDYPYSFSSEHPEYSRK